MKLHRNAKTTPTSRLELVRRTVDDGWRYQAVADGYGVSVRTVAKWVQRFRQLGAAGLEDGSSRPQQTPHITPPVRVTFIRQLREQHGLPAWAIGRALRMPRSTVGAWLRRLGLSQRPIAPSVPIQRYEWPHPGDLLHVDIKPLGRFRRVGHRIHGNPRLASPGAGWEYVHVAVDDHTRLAYVEVLADQRGPTCAAFLERTVIWFGARHITSRRVMSDNGSGYVSRAFRAARAARTLRHLRTRPYTPRTNGESGALHSDAPPGMGIRAAVCDVRPTPARPAAVAAVLQSRPATRESELSTTVITATECCLMNNVFDFNN